jgi:hypothetical protein
MAATRPPAAPEAAVPQLGFAVLGAECVAYAAVPTLRFALRVEAPGGEAVRSILLDTQIQIAARRRRYDTRAHDRLFELFGPPEGWGATLRTLPWTRLTVTVPPFTGATEVGLDVVCTYDLEVAASRYFAALSDGDVPVELLFSGTVFFAGPEGALQATRLSWEQEADYALPVAVWRETMDRHFPHAAWLRLDRERFDALAAFKSRRALATWEDAIDVLLAAEEARE